MSKRNQEKENTQIGGVPVQIINQLNEHTAGGFVLFYFNSEDGSPEQIMTFDSPAHCLALQKHISDWSSALNDLNIESERHQFECACQNENADDEDSEDA